MAYQAVSPDGHARKIRLKKMGLSKVKYLYKKSKIMHDSHILQQPGYYKRFFQMNLPFE